MKSFFSRVFSTIVGNLLTFAVIGIFLGILVFLSIAFGGGTVTIKKDSVLEITLDQPIMESEMDRQVSIFSFSGEKTPYYLSDIIHSINEAATDDKIKGISLKLDHFQGGMTQADDIRTALENFKKSGKFIYAYGNNTSQASYYIMSVADKLYQNPMGMPIIQGLSGEIMFFKEFGDKYGIDYQVIRHGAYKSAVEPYLRNDLSPENREQYESLLGDVWKNISTKIAASRKQDLVAFNIAVDSLYSLNPEDGLKHKLFDGLILESEYDLSVLKKADNSIKQVNEKNIKKHITKLEDYAAQLTTKTGSDKVAVLYASGAISEGDGFDGIQSKTYVEAIQKIADDDKIKAVVLRVNSPGGSANASDQILYELALLRKKKPVIVSFGDVAASGGYYIAQASDRIFANPNTITGSIGVLGMIPSVKKLANNHGIYTDIVRTNANADQLKSLTNPLSADAHRVMMKSIESVYNRFVNHIVTNRKMTFEAVDKIGGGRVWSGSSAKELKLVDEFGSLQDAINYAAKLSKVDNYSLESFPKRKEAFEELMESFTNTSVDQKISKELGTEGFELYKQVKQINENKGIQVRMPFNITLK